MAGALQRTARSEQRRAKLVAIAGSLPEVEISGDAHLALRVRKKTFAYYLFDHHGDGLVALACKAPRGEQARCVRESPERYFVPPYLGARGWVALRLDLARVDWEEVTDLLFASYRMTAPKTLGASVV